MPMLPMGFTEFADLELEHVSTSQEQQGLVGGMLRQSQIKAKGAVRKPKTEFVDTPDHQLGVRSNVKFKKPMAEPGQSTSWLAMMETEAGFMLGQQQSDQLNALNPMGNASSINLNASTTPMVTMTSNNALSKSNGEKKTSSSVNKGETSARKYYPAPYCSCTGTNQQCYRWGNGGWQSACCTTKISMYPLPMNPKKKGSRVAGRKMSAGAFSKLLDRLAVEGVDVNSSVDLRPHWAKHGTNRYVTIK